MPKDVTLYSDVFDKKTWITEWDQGLLELKLKNGRKLVRGPLDIAVSGEYGKGTFGINLVVKDCSEDLKKEQPAAEKKKATLITTSVKLAKDQTVILKTDVPESYASLVLSIRPAVKGKEEPAWRDASATKTSSGKESEVTGSFDLSGLNAKIGDKFEVALRIKSRPDFEYYSLLTDKTLTIQ